MRASPTRWRNAALFEGKPARARRSSAPLVEQAAAAGRRLSRAATRRARRRGALDFDAAEAEFVIDSAEHVRAIELRVAQRCASADRGMHDLRERRRGARAGEREDADAVSRARRSRTSRSSSSSSTTLASLGIDAQLAGEDHHARPAGHHASACGITRDRPFIESLIVRSMPQARVPADEHRPLRPGAHAVRALHLADPPLSGPRRASDVEGAHRRTGAARPCATSRTQLAVHGREHSRSSRSARTKPTATSPRS